MELPEQLQEPVLLVVQEELLELLEAVVDNLPDLGNKPAVVQSGNYRLELPDNYKEVL